MKMLICGLATSFGLLASGAMADRVVSVDGEFYLLSTLMENCQSITDDPAAQVACFSAISKLLDEQSDQAQPDAEVVTETLDALRAAAEYQDDDSGLSIAGTDCKIQVLYYNNYFHISRRNVSTIDLFSAEFDVSKLLHDQMVKNQPLSKGFMDGGVNAVIRGGAALDSTLDNFTPRSARTTLDVYASEVVSELPAMENQAFDFVLIHPQRSQASADIWNAFDAFVDACKK